MHKVFELAERRLKGKDLNSLEKVKNPYKGASPLSGGLHDLFEGLRKRYIREIKIAKQFLQPG